jgi:preprotein translocase subunit SecG
VYTLLLALLLIVGIFLTVVVLLQAGKGGGLAAMGGGGGPGTDNLIGGRQAATLLTKSTWVSGALFLGLALMLSVLSSRRTGGPESILQGQFQSAPTAPAPVLPGTQDQPVLPGTEPQQPAAPAGETPATGTTPPQP